jgi:prepilin-type N-terminal cleavage/methylation domain-containing protein
MGLYYRRAGFSLLETLVALVLLAAVLLAVLSTGQFILARLYESDLRFRASVYSQSLLDSLRATACARLTASTSAQAPFTASWVVTDMLDVVQLDVAVSAPQRGTSVARAYNASALLNCPEP